MARALVVGLINCAPPPPVPAGPLGGVAVGLELLNQRKQRTKYTAATGSSPLGEWGVVIPIARLDEGDFVGGFARINVVCPGALPKAGPNFFNVPLKEGKNGGTAVNNFLKAIVGPITESFVRELLDVPAGAPLTQAFLPNERVFFAWGANATIGTPFNCC
jgi:hypothetical protein